MRQSVAVVGAGPAGLTAAVELTRHGVPCLVLEADPDHVGGIARTEEYRGYRFDIGGHRFFTKNDEIRRLWHEFLPDSHFLKVARLSRIFYNGKFFDYPLSAGDALRKLGVLEAGRCGLSYVRQAVAPKREALSFEDWVVAHFGRRLYEIFFKTYTEKVWGMPCQEISADWAAQRIKGLSLFEAVRHAVFKGANGSRGSKGEIVKTLIEEFEYPARGPGMMWEHVAGRLRSQGVPIVMGTKVERIEHAGGAIRRVVASGPAGTESYDVTHVVSTMPIRSLVRGLAPEAPADVQAAADGLRYRDFVTVVLIVDQADVFPDNWIYIHDPSVKVGRIQNFKNWSPEMVPDPAKTALGLEYFCFDGDSLWSSSDDVLIALARDEVARIGIVDPDRVVDGTVVRMRKAYPVYDNDYRAKVAVIRAYLDETLPKLQVCGRNGMHKYNNQDHAMMTALMAARNIAGERWDQWLVNEDAEYHEEVRANDRSRMVPFRVPSPPI